MVKLAANPRVDMMIWFLLRDEVRVATGWQSGLLTAGGARKPAREIFERLSPPGSVPSGRSVRSDRFAVRWRGGSGPVILT